jgi:hypothetical protein
MKDEERVSTKEACESGRYLGLCKERYSSEFRGTPEEDLFMYWDEECVRTDQEGTYEKVEGVGEEQSCFDRNN